MHQVQQATAIVDFFRRRSIGFMPTSTGRLTVGVGCKQPVTIRDSVSLRFPMKQDSKVPVVTTRRVTIFISGANYSAHVAYYYTRRVFVAIPSLILPVRCLLADLRGDVSFRHSNSMQVPSKRKCPLLSKICW